MIHAGGHEGQYAIRIRHRQIRKPEETCFFEPRNGQGAHASEQPENAEAQWHLNDGYDDLIKLDTVRFVDLGPFTSRFHDHRPIALNPSLLHLLQQRISQWLDCTHPLAHVISIFDVFDKEESNDKRGAYDGPTP